MVKLQALLIFFLLFSKAKDTDKVMTNRKNNETSSSREEIPQKGLW